MVRTLLILLELHKLGDSKSSCGNSENKYSMHFIICLFPALAPNSLNLWLYVHIKAYLESNAWNKMSSICFFF